jgi:hypothetical protein
MIILLGMLARKASAERVTLPLPANLVPAIHATRIDPILALRGD